MFNDVVNSSFLELMVVDSTEKNIPLLFVCELNEQTVACFRRIGSHFSNSYIFFEIQYYPRAGAISINTKETINKKGKRKSKGHYALFSRWGYPVG